MRLHHRPRTATWSAPFTLLGLVAVLVLLAPPDPAAARPLARKQPPRVLTQPADLAAISQPAAARGDTVVLLGGPGRLDGRFENDLGQPDWHGWTSIDHTSPADTFWSISTYHADALGGHGPGNHAMWCGTEFDNGAVGYGNDWRQHLGWSHQLDDPAEPVTVRVLARLNHDTEPGYDFLHLQVHRGGLWQTLRSWTGWRIDRPVDVATVLEPQDLAGDGGDEIRLRFFFFSDETWSDEDGLYPTSGACQIDDVEVQIDGSTVSFDDFEPGSEPTWVPRFYDGAGDFAQLLAGLQDLDPCRENPSVQVAFIDDGLVVPGTGGSPCLSWCYGPGGFVVNSNGGLLGPEGRLANGVVSPPLAWPAGAHDLLLEFDAYVHETLRSGSPGIVYRWRVRSTANADPGKLAVASWRQRDEVFAGGPAYRRHHELIGDLLVPDRQWVQIELQVLDYGAVLGLPGHDATPAPYFDNVAIKAIAVTGPRIVVDERHLPQDTFPESGVLDPRTPALNSCRFDMAASRLVPGRPHTVGGDSIVVGVHVLNPQEQLAEPPRLVVRLRTNPFFDPARIVPPDEHGFIDLVAVADTCRTETGAAVPDRWAFDLPDTGLIFPGDVLHYFFEVRTLRGRGPGLVTWPADTTGWSDVSPTSPYPALATMRALPTVIDEDGTQPAVLVWGDDRLPSDGHEPWDRLLAPLGLTRGVDYDLYRTRAAIAGVGNGLGGRSTGAQLVGYGILLHDSGRATRHTLSDGTQGDPSPDVQRLRNWLDSGGKKAFFSGDDLAHDLAQAGPASQLFLAGYLGLQLLADDAAPHLDDQRAPTVERLAGNGVFGLARSWLVQGGCPDARRIDLVAAGSGAQRLAEFLGPGGVGGTYPQAAAVRRQTTFPARDVIALPYSLGSIEADPGAGGLTQAAILIADVLAAFGRPIEPTTAGVPPAPLTAVAYPNPFNPRTTISYALPVSGPTRLTIHDLRGRRVRTLLDGWQPAGAGAVIWDGIDGEGRPCASGLYVHRLETDAGRHLGKMMLLR